MPSSPPENLRRRRPVRPACLSLGSNRGDRLRHLRAGLAALARRGIVPAACSGIYRTAPVGGPPQEDYLNLAVVAETDLEPRELLTALHEVERERGRDRDREGRWGPRTLDVDLLLLGDDRLDEPDLTIPHPRMHLRRFVLAPLAEIAPDRVDPRSGRTIRALLRDCPDLSPVVRVASPPSPGGARLRAARGSATVFGRAPGGAPRPRK